MSEVSPMLLSGNQALALAARDMHVHFGTGYPGTPSTEILENFDRLGGKAQWAPNEKVALEVGLGGAFAGARVLVTMKHVGVNVAADPLFTSTYTGVTGGLVLVSADDPDMHSSQNEQDNRNYARAAGIPCFEPSDSQETYDLFIKAMECSEEFQIPVLFRMTTRTCHSKSMITPHKEVTTPKEVKFVRDMPAMVMVPAYARPAHRKLRAKLKKIEAWNEAEGPNPRLDNDTSLGIITSGISYQHCREAAPEASILKIGMCYPLPMEKIKAFVDSVERCVVIEEGDPYLADCIRAAGKTVESKDEMYRFGELNTDRVKRILNNDTSDEFIAPKGVAPRLCSDCPHRATFSAFSDAGAIVAGDIGCYTLGALPPFSALDTCVCMGASITVGLGLRHVLPNEEARKVISVIGDSTFVHSGITGLVEMVYNRPKTGHVVVIVDNDTTAMTGMQEHPGTGRALDHTPAPRIDFEALAKAIGVENVYSIDPHDERERFQQVLEESMASDALTLIIAKRICSLAEPKIKKALAAIASKG